MGMQNSGWQSAGARLEDLSNIWPFSEGAPISRASLLATASPSAAQAQFADEPDHLRPFRPDPQQRRRYYGHRNREHLGRSRRQRR